MEIDRDDPDPDLGLPPADRLEWPSPSLAKLRMAALSGLVVGIGVGLTVAQLTTALSSCSGPHINTICGLSYACA